MAATAPLQDLEDAELAYNRVKPEMDALSLEELSTMNVDVVSAASIALGVADRILAHRDRMAKLPEFEIGHVDKLIDYAKAAWYSYVTNLPAPEPGDAAQLMNEVSELRAKLLMWAAPLVGAGKFEPAAIARIKEGAGNKDTPSDLVALVGLYRSKWDDVKAICGVTEQELTRGAEIGPAVFALVSRREFQTASSISDGSLRVRRAWTLLDRAYAQSRRALSFLRFDDGDVDTLAPSLRRNLGTRPSTPSEPAPAPTPPVGAPQNGPTPSVVAPSVGGGSSPFMAKS
jgi:hypothetical protein